MIQQSKELEAWFQTNEIIIGRVCDPTIKEIFQKNIKLKFCSDDSEIFNGASTNMNELSITVIDDPQLLKNGE